MTYILDFSSGIDLAIIPESEEMAMMQNLYCLLNTAVAEVPMYREYGLDKQYMSMPFDLAKTMIVAAAAEALGKFFPELKIVETTFKTEKDSPHILLPRFEVTDDE